MPSLSNASQAYAEKFGAQAAASLSSLGKICADKGQVPELDELLYKAVERGSPITAAEARNLSFAHPKSLQTDGPGGVLPG